MDGFLNVLVCFACFLCFKCFFPASLDVFSPVKRGASADQGWHLTS